MLPIDLQRRSLPYSPAATPRPERLRGSCSRASTFRNQCLFQNVGDKKRSRLQIPTQPESAAPHRRILMQKQDVLPASQHPSRREHPDRPRMEMWWA